MNILTWTISGALIGWVANFTGGIETASGLIGDIMVGSIGALIGGWASDGVGMGDEPGVDRSSKTIDIFWAVIGAVLLLLLIKLMF